jgi:hypothetical protein
MGKTMRKTLKSLFFLFLLLALGVHPSGTVTAQDSSSTQYFITSVDSGTFPDISLRVRAVNVDGDALSDLGADQIQIFEDGNRVSQESITILNSEEGPVAISFLIDMGKYSKNALSTTRLRVLLNDYLNNHFRDGIDSIAIYARSDGGETTDRNITLLEPTHSQAELKTAIAHIEMVYSKTASSVLSGVEQVADDMTVFLGGQAGRASTAVVVISPYNETNLPEIIPLAQAIREKTITGYVIYTYENNQRLDPFKQFVDLTGGQIVRVPSSSNTTQVENTISMYSQLYSRTKLINIKYRSSYGQSGTRNVAILNANESVERAADHFAYSVNISDPQFAVANSPQEKIKAGESFGLVVELTEFPDQIDRRLMKAELYSDGLVIASLPGADNQAELTSPIEFNVSTEGWKSGSHVIDVTVTDELGRSGSITPVNVSISAVVPVEPIKPIPTAAPVNPCDPITMQCVTDNLIYPIAILAIVVVIILIFLVIKTNKKIGEIMQKAGSAVGESFEDMKTAVYGRRKPGAKNNKPLAKVHILIAGKGLQNEVVNLYSQTTSFGRNPQKCDHQLYGMGEHSTVSGLHCTITYDYGKFLITDDNSQNGTYVRNKILTANEPFELHDGDEIVLGVPTSGGAKMRFEVVDKSVLIAPEGEDSGEPDPDDTQVGINLQESFFSGIDNEKTDEVQLTDVLLDNQTLKNPKKPAKTNDDWMEKLQ